MLPTGIGGVTVMKIQQSQGWLQLFLVTGCQSQTHTRAGGCPFGRKGFTCCPVLWLFVHGCYKETPPFQSVKPTVCVSLLKKINR